MHPQTALTNPGIASAALPGMLPTRSVAPGQSKKRRAALTARRMFVSLTAHLVLVATFLGVWGAFPKAHGTARRDSLGNPFFRCVEVSDEVYLKTQDICGPDGSEPGQFEVDALNSMLVLCAGTETTAGLITVPPDEIFVSCYGNAAASIEHEYLLPKTPNLADAVGAMLFAYDGSETSLLKQPGLLAYPTERKCAAEVALINEILLAAQAGIFAECLLSTRTSTESTTASSTGSTTASSTESSTISTTQTTTTTATSSLSSTGTTSVLSTESSSLTSTLTTTFPINGLRCADNPNQAGSFVIGPAAGHSCHEYAMEMSDLSASCAASNSDGIDKVSLGFGFAVSCYGVGEHDDNKALVAGGTSCGRKCAFNPFCTAFYYNVITPGKKPTVCHFLLCVPFEVWALGRVKPFLLDLIRCTRGFGNAAVLPFFRNG